MNKENYPFNHISQILVFEFESIGPKRTIKKQVEITLIDHQRQIFNASLLDVLPNGVLSDLAVSNNSDMPKVLTTVFRALSYFFKYCPYAKVLIEGSTISRTRLYQMAISKYLHELEPKFSIFGFKDGSFEYFMKGSNYTRFIISLR